MPSRRPRHVTMKHYLIIPFEAWGHSRPEITLSLHLLRSHPHLLITLLLSSITLDKTLPLISSFDLDSSEADRLRVVPYPNLTAPPANPLETDEDDAAIWRITNWWVDKIMPPLLKYLKVGSTYMGPI
jgi:hypothetical protein